MGTKRPQKMDGYVRVSRRMGREGAGYISPKVQQEAIQRWADYRGVEVAAWHVDEDESGGTQNRPGLREAMRRVEAGETDGIACWRLNRFARNVGGAIGDVERVQAAGGSLAFVEEDIDPTGPFGSFLLTVLLAVSTLERDNLVAGWKTAKTRAMERGAKIGPTPFGYARAEDGCLVPDPRTGPLVTEAFTRAARDGLHAALDYLAAEAPERTWTTTTVRRVLTNRSYLGEARYGELLNREAHTPLVERGTFERAQPDDAPERRAAAAFPLSGLATCATCGSPLVGSRGGRNAQRIYRCSGGLATHNGERCQAPANVTAELLERLVLERLREGYAAADRNREVRGGEPPADIDELGRAIEDAETELEAFASDPTARRVLGEAAWSRALEARADAVEAARAAYNAAAEQGRASVRAVPLDVLASLAPDEAGEVLRGAVGRVVVQKGRTPLAGRVTVELDHSGT